MNYKQEVSSGVKSDNYFPTWTKLKKASVFSLKIYHAEINNDVFIVFLRRKTKFLKISSDMHLFVIWSPDRFFFFFLKKRLKSTAAFHDT